MHFDGPVVVWISLALLPIVVPATLGAILKRLFPKSGCLAVLALVGLGIGLMFGVSFYLDSLGTSVRGEVISKKEQIVYHADGSWDHALLGLISYRSSETAPLETAQLDVRPARFDDLNRGDFLTLRIPSAGAMLNITRLEDQGTFSQVFYWLSHQPFLMLFLLGSVLLLALRSCFQVSLPQLFFLTGVVIIGSWWLADIVGPIWTSTTTLLGSMNSASGTVREIHTLSGGEGVTGWFQSTVFSSPQLVLLDVVQPGHFDPMLTVDEIDVGSVALRPKQVLNIEYSTGDPRIAYLSDASRSYIWKNAFIGTLIALLLLAGIGWVAYQFGALPSRRSSKRRRRNGHSTDKDKGMAAAS